jgi:hypothetical protein
MSNMHDYGFDENQKRRLPMSNSSALLCLALILGGFLQIGIGVYTGHTELRWFLVGFGLCGILGGIKIAKLS